MARDVEAGGDRGAARVVRIQWRPSRLEGVGLLALGLLAAASVFASELPTAAASLLAAACLLHGWRLAGRAWRQRAVGLVWNTGSGVLLVDGNMVSDPALAWRGPLAWLCYRDPAGRAHRLVFWPDVLDAAGRRELCLAADAATASPRAASMAP